MNRSMGDMGVVDLEALYAQGQKEDDREAAYKTVATFAGLTQKMLWLKDGPSANDGHEIHAPFDDPFFYRYVEHALAHILFESDPTAKKMFVASYLATTNEALSKMQLPLLTDDQLVGLRSLVRTIVGLLEDARIESLWGMLYPGSFDQMRLMHIAQVRPLLKATHRSLESFLIIAASGSPVAEGRFTRFLPALKEALKKVERRSFSSTLAVSKWLVQKLVDEALKTTKPPPQELVSELAKQALAKMDPKASAPPPPDGPSSGQRQAALTDLLKTADNTLAPLTSIPDDWDEKKFPPSEYEKSIAQSLVEAALRTQVSNEEKLDQFLATSERKMADQVEEIREALGQQVMKVDGWITKNAFGKVNLRDVKRGGKSVMRDDDGAAVGRLRAIFYRTLGRRRHTLQEYGSIIDVAAYIEGKVAHELVPCFRSDELSRGFKVLVLLDRSSSMLGKKTEQAERACAVLSRALKFPFVDFHIWGFQSHSTALDLTRYDRDTLSFSSEKSVVGGHTPLHLAMRVAVRFMELGNEAKQIIIVTDGWPSFTSTKGKSNSKALRWYVREEVQRARRLGMNVTGVVIGKGMDDAGLQHMLGPPANWRRMDPHNLGSGLVRVVTTSFTKYLRHG